MPYVYAVNIPIKFIDINGDSISLGNLYDRNGDNLKYPMRVRAFELFASSDFGKKWILDRAQKGFKLNGTKVKFSIIAEEEGYLSKKGIDVTLRISDIGEMLKNEGSTDIATIAGAEGLARAHIADNGRLKVTYWSDISGSKSTSVIENLRAVDTWGHEILFHGDLYEKVFLNSGKLATKAEAGAYHNSADVKNSVYIKQIDGILQRASNLLKAGYSPSQLKTHIQSLPYEN